MCFGAGPRRGAFSARSGLTSSYKGIEESEILSTQSGRREYRGRGKCRRGRGGHGRHGPIGYLIGRAQEKMAAKQQTQLQHQEEINSDNPLIQAPKNHRPLAQQPRPIHDVSDIEARLQELDVIDDHREGEDENEEDKEDCALLGIESEPPPRYSFVTNRISARIDGSSSSSLTW